MDPKKIVGALLLGVLALWIVGWASTRSHKHDAPHEVKVPPTDKWQVSQSRDEMDDSQTVAFSVDADDVIPGPIGNVIHFDVRGLDAHLQPQAKVCTDWQ